MAALLGIGLGFFASALAGSRRVGLGQVHSCATRLGQSDRNRLLGRSRAMLSLTHMMDFLAYEFARLDGRSFAFGLVFARPSKSFFFRHLPYLSVDGFGEEMAQLLCHRNGRMI
ncbi:MAG: hypothetical protein WAU82_11865 [Candidatus Binatus sp.]